jgi:phosphoglycolate phosphatase
VTRLLVMWDIDHTLVRTSGVAGEAWRTAFTAVTGAPWRITPSFRGRTDLDVFAESQAVHGVAGHSPESFFSRYVAEVHATRHLFAERGTLLPGVRAVLDELGTRGDVVQTLVTGNVPEVAALKIDAFGLTPDFDAEVGGYGTDDTNRATLVRLSHERAERKYGERFRPVVIGDTENDVSAALASNARAIAVATGSVPAPDLLAAGAHVVLGDLTDLPAVIAAITAWPASPPPPGSARTSGRSSA